jgi:putative membrane protein
MESFRGANVWPGVLGWPVTKARIQPDPHLKEARLPELAAGKRRRLRMLIHIELTLLFVIMLCAALMARGIGFIG